MDSVRVRLFGGLSVEGRSELELGSRKGRTVLKLLALARGAPVPTEHIAEVLWGDDQPARPSEQVGVLVSRLRGVLGADRIVRSDAGYSLRADWYDVEELERLADTARSALDEGRVGAARAAAEAGLALACQPLLADEDGIWVETERAAVAVTAARVRRLAVDAATAAGDHDGAAVVAEQALADDPYDETVLRSLMRAHLSAGRPASALAAYARVRSRVGEDLGVPLTAETEVVHAHALAAADGDEAGRTPPTSTRYAVDTLAGRRAELAELDQVLGQVLEHVPDSAPLILIEGEAGIGKTALLRAWTASASPSALVLRGGCDELGRDLPLQPVADALADHLREVGPEQAATIVADDAATLAPLIGPVRGAAAPVLADLEVGRAGLYAALAAAIGRAGGDRPVVLAIDDVHQAGPGTLAWLSYARHRMHRLVILLATRPGGAARLDPQVRLRLGPLSLPEAAELVGDARVEQLYARSNGHPLLLTSLAASASSELPDNLRDAVAEQVASLGPDVAATLRVAAALGEDCDLDLLARVESLAAVEVLGHLETAERAGIVVERGAIFAFRHELVREALDAGTGAARRAWIHRRAAGLLSERPDPDVLAVAVHARAGGDRALASSSFVAAAQAAASRFDLDAAETYAQAALEVLPTSAALTTRARLLMHRSRFDAAANDAEQAVASGGGAPALETAGWIAYYRRRYDDARAFADAAIDQASDPDVRTSALALAGRTRHGLGDLAGALDRLQAVDPGAPAPLRGVADVWLAQVHNHRGRPEEALEALSRPRAEPDALAHPWAPLHLRFNRAMALGQLGRVDEAFEACGDLDRAVHRAGDVGVRFRAVSANVRAWLLRWSGHPEDADAHNLAALAATGDERGPSADGFAEAHYVALLDLADGCLLRDDVDAAQHHVRRLAPLDTWTGTMAWHQRHRLDLIRARVAWAGGDGNTAGELAHSVEVDAAARGAARYQAFAMAWHAVFDPRLPIESVHEATGVLARCAVLDRGAVLRALATTRGLDAGP